MANKIGAISYKGKTIHFVDYKDCKTKEQMIARLHEAESYVLGINGKILSLSDFSNTFGSKEYMDEAKRLAKELFDEKTEKGAVLGINGLKKILLQGYNLFVKTKIVPFGTKEEALEYLVG